VQEDTRRSRRRDAPAHEKGGLHDEADLPKQRCGGSSGVSRSAGRRRGARVARSCGILLSRSQPAPAHVGQGGAADLSGPRQPPGGTEPRSVNASAKGHPVGSSSAAP
jgi:hypothetical protein